MPCPASIMPRADPFPFPAASTSAATPEHILPFQMGRPETMKHHPMRRDLWTDPAVNTKDAKVWQEYTNNHPLSRRSINVDRVSGKKNIVPYRDISKSLDKYVNVVDDNWGSTGKGKKGKKIRRASSESDEEEQEMIITLSNSGDGCTKELRIKPSTCLRNLFNDYAEECGTPLRCLRFSFNGSTLFLSSLGRKTARDLNLTNRASISVTNILETPSSDSTEEAESPKQIKKSAKKGSGKKHQNKKKSNKSKPTIKLYETEETAKEHHSIVLSKLFEEAEPIFKVIRQRLNNLSLEKKSPKARRFSDKKRDESPTSVVYNPDTFGLGGKAGKTSYTVNVGQVENLYISIKRNSKKCISRQNAMIDLHGCTKDQALSKLDEALVDWVDTAMKGEYPWVMPVEIVCGGGNQILSEVVEGWIRARKNVANAPKGQ
jgi:DNA-nicking Smr family endonuclease